jgi:hypothetical protein
MIKFRKTLGDRLVLLGIRGSVVSEVDGIALVDLRRHGDSFRCTIESSLRLLRDYDPRRYARLRRHVRWIVNQVSLVTNGLDYNPRIAVCTFEFSEIAGVNEQTYAAQIACSLVRVATQGLILSRGIQQGPEYWIRVARICITEQNRFAARMSAVDPECYSADRLQWEPDLDETYWRSPTGGPEALTSCLARAWRDPKAEASTPPNAGSAGAPPSS